jgi:hypothetical protein
VSPEIQRAIDRYRRFANSYIAAIEDLKSGAISDREFAEMARTAKAELALLDKAWAAEYRLASRRNGTP